MHIREGDRIFTLVPSANLDPAKYDRPDELDIDRGAAQHLGMGVGSHFCLGALLAGALVAALVEGLLERVEAFSIDTDKLVRNTNRGVINNFLSAPMRIDSARARSADEVPL